MTGGLIQLVTTGIQDVPISSNPEITFFKTVYKKYTQFSINQQLKYLGAKKFNTEGIINLDYNGDLLYGQFFKLEIPYFDILRNTVSIKNLPNIIDKLELNYNNELCIMINYNNNWYLIPEYLFKLSNITTLISSIDIENISDNINDANLTSYLNVNNITDDIAYYNIKDNGFSPLINILKIKGNFWEQYWLDILSTTNNILLSNALTTLVSYLTNVNNNLINKIYTNYYKTFNNKYNQYFNFNMGINEVQQYFNYINTPNSLLSTITQYNCDMDCVYNYCKNNNLNFDLYKNNTLQYNSLTILYILNNFYNNNLLYTFTKSDSVNTNNIYNDITEWTRLLNINSTLPTLNNQIYNKYKDNYYLLEKSINILFTNFKITDSNTIYPILWLFKLKYDNIINSQSTNPIINTRLNFNTFYDITKNIEYNQYNYLYNGIYNNENEIRTKLKYNTTTALDLINIFAHLSFKIINYLILAKKQPVLLNPIILWSNNVMLRLFNRYVQYQQHPLWNGNLINTDQTFSYYIYPGNPYTYNNFKDSFFELLYKTSFIGNISITNGAMINLLQNMLIIQNSQNNLYYINNYQYFYDLKINNTYTYNYISASNPTTNIFIINKISNTIIILYDNNYDEQNMNISITLTNSSQINDITQYILNIRKEFIQINNLYTGVLYIDINNIINLQSIVNNTIMTLNITYTTQIPLIIFPQITQYSNNQVLRYDIINKNEDNTYNLNRLTVNNMIDFNSYNVGITLPNQQSFAILNIEYYDNSKIIKPNINSIIAPILSTTRTIDPSSISISSSILSLPNSNQPPSNDIVIYNYMISYITHDNKESTAVPIMNNQSTTAIGGNNINIINNIPISNNYNIKAINVYRTIGNTTTPYYKVPINIIKYINDLNNNKATTDLIDNITDSQLISQPLINNNNIYFTNINQDSTNLYYFYKISFIQNNIESSATPIVDYVFASSANYIVSLNNLPNNINIYRTIGLSSPNITNPQYYYIATISTNTYNDTMNDNILIKNLTKFPVYSTYTTLSSINKDNNNNFISSNKGLNGTYYYKISYISTNNESECSNVIGPITITHQAVKLDSLPISLDSNVIGRKIYRTKGLNVNNYYLVATINDNTSTSYIDSVADSVVNNNIIPIINNRCDKHFVNISLSNNMITLRDLNNNPINLILNYSIINNMHIDIIPQNNYSIYNNTQYTYINPYYQLNQPINPNSFYYLIDPTNYTNYIKLVIDNSINGLVPSDTIDITIKYNILSIQQTNFVPNLEQYISLSTDYRYFNNKQSNDFDNYLFNKPFMMLMNTTNTNSFSSYPNLINNFSEPYINFYNIPFRLTKTSIITINNNKVLYLFPVASSQFFLYNNLYYYTIDNNNQIPLSPSTIPNDFSKLISTDIDEFYYNIIDITINIRNTIVDYYYNQYNDIVNINNDIISIINLIQNIDNSMDNLYKTIFNSTTLYGTTTQTIVNNFKNVNTFNNLYLSNFQDNSSLDQPPSFYYTPYNIIYNYNIQIKYLDVKKYIKKDFLTFSQYVSSSKYLTMTSIYNIYSSKYIISYDLTHYLKDISAYFIQHIQYAASNRDYLAISNGSNIVDKYNTLSQNIDYINNIAYNSKNSSSQVINLLYPIQTIDNFSQMLINNNLIPISLNNNSITTYSTGILDQISENNNYDSQLIFDKTNTFDIDTFNFIGIISLNNTNNINNNTIMPVSTINIGLNTPFVINNNLNYTYPSITTKTPMNYIKLNNLLSEYNSEYYIRLLYLYDYSVYNHYILKIKDLPNINFINTYYYAWIYPQTTITSIYDTRIINNINQTITSNSFIITNNNILTITLNFDYNITNNTVIRIANNAQCNISEDVLCNVISNYQFIITLTNPNLYNLASYYIYGYQINDINKIMDSINIIIDSNGIVNFVNKNLEQTGVFDPTTLVHPNIPANTYIILDDVIYYYKGGTQIDISPVYNTSSYYLSPGKVKSIKIINDIVIQNNYDLFIKNQNNDVWTHNSNNISYSVPNYPYKYYVNNYSLESFTTEIIDPTTILEYNYSFPKPTINFGGNYNSTNNTIDLTSISLPSNSIFYILISNNNTSVFFNNDIINNKYYYFTNLNNYTLYYSLQHPNIVSVGTYNLLLTQIDGQNFIITSNNNIFLENNEIIIIQDTIFIVLGKNIISGNYDLQIVYSISLNKTPNISGTYNFYWTLGTYQKSHFNTLPNVIMNSTLRFYTTKVLLPGISYYDGINMCITMQNETSSNYIKQSTKFPLYANIYCFTEDTLNIKLFYVQNNGKIYYYSLDNFVKLKLYDKIYYNNNIYEITYIKNKKIYLYPDITVFPLNKTFIDCKLPYQPYEIKNITINLDYSITPNIDKYNIIINEPNDINKLKLIPIRDNIIPIEFRSYLDVGSCTIRLMNTNYNAIFSNLYKVSSMHPVSTNIDELNITIDCGYIANDDTIQILNNIDLFYNYLFNYIINIKTVQTVGNTTLYYLKLLYPNNIPSINNKNILLSLSNITFNQFNYYSHYKFKYNYSLQYYDTFKPADTININKYTLVNDIVVNIEQISNVEINTSFSVGNYTFDYIINEDITNNLFIVNGNINNNQPLTISNIMAFTTFIPNNASSFNIFSLTSTNQLIPNMLWNGISTPITKIPFPYPLTVPTLTIYNPGGEYIYYYGRIVNVNDIPTIINPSSNNNNNNNNNELQQIIYYPNTNTGQFINIFQNTNQQNIPLINNLFNIPFITENDTPYYLTYDDLILPNNTNKINASLMVVYNGQYINVLNLPVDYYDNNGFIINMNNNIKYKYYYNNYEFDYYRKVVVKNTNIIYGSYHLLLEITNDNTNYIHLVKITYPNNLLFCTNTKYDYTSTFYLDKLILIHINYKNEFTFASNNIQITNKLPTENKNNIELIASYYIRKYSVPNYNLLTNNYLQNIILVDQNNPNGSIALDLSKYQSIYIYPTDTTAYNITLNTSLSKLTTTPPLYVYTIKSNVYFDNLSIIYIKDTNYIKSIVQTNIWDVQFNNHNDSTLSFNNNLYEYNIFNVNFYNTSNNNIQVFNNSSLYQYYDYSDIISTPVNLQMNYNIYNLNTSIVKMVIIDNSIYNQISLDHTINDIKLIYDGYNSIPIFIKNIINNDVVFDKSKFYPTTDKLNNKIQLQLNININDIINYVKPFISSWNLISCYTSFTPINQSVIGNSCVIQYDSTHGIIQQTNLPYSFNILTNNEIIKLSQFLNDIQNPINNNYYQILLWIQNDMFYNDNIINRWINNIEFFKNVQYYVNSYLIIKNYNYAQYNSITGITYSSTQVNNIIFNGTEILFNNTSVPYITNEFTYNSTSKIVYRSSDNLANVQMQINNFINNIMNTSTNDIYFGVNINYLLTYLNSLGNDYNNYINKTTLDVYNYEPIKYLMNLIDSKYDTYNAPIITTINDTSKIFDNINTLSYITFTKDQQIGYNGLYSLNNYKITNNSLNNTNIYNNNPINIITKTLQNINIFYDFKIVFNSNLIRSDCSYSLSYYNGNLIGSIVPTTTNKLYSNELVFKSYYNLKSTDMIRINQTKQYNITPLLLGQLYQITFIPQINVNNITNIYYSGIQLLIERTIITYTTITDIPYNINTILLTNTQTNTQSNIATNICTIIIPPTLNLSQNNNIFELRYNTIIKTIIQDKTYPIDNYNNSKYLIKFSNQLFIDSLTINQNSVSNIYIIVNNNIVPLNYDGSNYYIIISLTLKSYIIQNRNYIIGTFISVDSSYIQQYNQKTTNIYQCTLPEDFINQSYTNHDNASIILNRFTLNSTINIIPDDIYLYNSNILWLYFNTYQNTYTSTIVQSNLTTQIITNYPTITATTSTQNIIDNTIINITNSINMINKTQQSNIMSATLLTYTQDLGEQELQQINSISAGSTILQNNITNSTVSKSIQPGNYYIANYLGHINNTNYFPFLYNNNSIVLDSNNNKILDTNYCTLFIYNISNIPVINQQTTINMIETNLIVNNLYINYNTKTPQIYGDINLININSLNGILCYNNNASPTLINYSLITPNPIKYYGYTIILNGKLNPKIINNLNSNITIVLGTIPIILTSINYDSINNKLTIYSLTSVPSPTLITIRINNIATIYNIISIATYIKYKYIALFTNNNNYTSFLLLGTNNSEVNVSLVNSNSFYIDKSITGVLYGYDQQNNNFIDYLNQSNNNSLTINNYIIENNNNNWLITIGQIPSYFIIDNTSSYTVSYTDIIVDRNDSKQIYQQFIIDLIENSDGTVSFLSTIYINQLCPITITRYNYDLTKIYNNPYIIKYNGHLANQQYNITFQSNNNNLFQYSISPIPINLNIIDNMNGDYINQQQLFFITDSIGNNHQINFINNTYLTNSISFSSTDNINISNVNLLKLTSYYINNITKINNKSLAINTSNYKTLLVQSNILYTYTISPIPSILGNILDLNQHYYITDTNILSQQINFTSIIGNSIYFTSPFRINLTPTLILSSYTLQFNKILKPEEYIKLQLNYTNNQEYTTNNNLYIIPCNNMDLSICSQYMYYLTLPTSTLTSIIKVLFYPNLLNNNLQNIIPYLTITALNIKCNVISIDINNRIVFSSPVQLDQTMQYSIIIYLLNNITPSQYVPFYYYNIPISFYQNSVNSFNILQQYSLNNLYIYVNENTINNYNKLSVCSNYSFYIISQPKYKIINTQKKQQINNNIKNIQQTINNTIETPVLENPNKIFEYIRLYIDDQLIEELNEFTFNTDYNLYSSTAKQKQLDKLINFKTSGSINDTITNTTTLISSVPIKLPLPITLYTPISNININNTDTTMIVNVYPYAVQNTTTAQIPMPTTNKIIQINKIIPRNRPESWELNIPLNYWFNYDAGQSIPLIAMPNSKIYIRYKLRDISSIISNDLSNNNYKFNITPSIKISLLSDTILLDTEERKLFGTFSHEYMISVYKTYTSKMVNQIKSTIPYNLSGLIKDIILITKPINTSGTAYNQIINNYDMRYQRYIDASNYYSLFIKNGYYTDNNQYNFVNDFNILENIDYEIINYPNKRYNQYITLFSMYDPRFLMYFTDNYCSQLPINLQQQTLFYYLKYMYNNSQTINKISPIDSMTFYVNGVELFAARDSTYFTNVVPYDKFKTTLPEGNYAYSFALYPLEKQPSGHLNFTHYDSVIFKIVSNSNIINETYTITPVVKEYNILRIISGIGSLAWL